jgi:hypothetical protein
MPKCLRRWELRILRQFLHSMFRVLLVLAAALSSLLKSRTSLQLKNLALRHQIGVLQRSAKKRPKLTSTDQFFWAWLCRVWTNWGSALVTVKPGTLVAWHRKGFRLFRTWKVRRGQPGQPAVRKNVRQLIRQMGRENPFRGAPRIHGGLLKLGIDIGETSVGKYMVRRPDVGNQNTSGVGPAPIATWSFSEIQFLDPTRFRTRHTVRNEPTLGAQGG